MNTFNSIQKENLVAQNQPSSPTIVSVADHSSTVNPQEQTLYMNPQIHDSAIPVGVEK